MAASSDAESTDRPAGELPLEAAVEGGTGGEAAMLGEFRLLRMLGSGGMANVYLAEQTSLKRRVALKVLRPDLLADDTYLERFAREAKAAAGLNHPNIVQVYAVGEEAGLHFIAQEFVQGMNLREFLAKKGPPEAGVAIHVIRQVAAALQAAAQAGIVHRDIKPENILLTRRGVVKVTDFGLAQLNREADQLSLTLTQVGTTMGTPLYMSPEQVNGARVDHRSDIYSLGVTCYHLLAGRPPFRGETAISVAVQHVNKIPEPLSDTRADLPRRLCDLVMKMMAKDPDDRFDGATEVLAELDVLQRRLRLPRGGAATEWTDYEPPVSLWARATGWLPDVDWRRHWRWLLLPAACLLVAAVAASASWLSRPGSPLAADPTNDPRVADSRTPIEELFAYAMMVDSEEAWQAVILKDPQGGLFVNRAKQRLAMHYLRTTQIDAARLLYDELALKDSEPKLRASGLAGQAIIASYQGRHKDSQAIIAGDLYEIRADLNSEMEGLIRDTITRNRVELKDEVRRDLEEFFRNAETIDDSATD